MTTPSHDIEALAKKVQEAEDAAEKNRGKDGLVKFAYQEDYRDAVCDFRQKATPEAWLTLTARNRELEQALAEAREALKPFAEIAAKLHHSWGEQQVLTLGSEMGILVPTITVGGLRRAARALATHAKAP